MEMRMRLLSGSLMLLVVGFLSVRSDSRPQSQSKPNPVLILPGASVGPLRLGDTRERVAELFPNKPNMDQEWREQAGCGTTINWLDLRNHETAGNVFIRLKEGKVFQIDAGTTSFHTAGNISMKSSPQEIRKQYPGLRAYILSTGFAEASGGRPLVYGLTAKKGLHSPYMSQIADVSRANRK
jgi:hypothetical protein